MRNKLAMTKDDAIAEDEHRLSSNDVNLMQNAQVESSSHGFRAAQLWPHKKWTSIKMYGPQHGLFVS